MIEPLWWIVGAYLVLGTALLLGTARPRAYEGAVLRFQSSVGVDLPQWLGEKLRRRMLANRRSQLIGGMVGIVASAYLVTSRTADVGALEVTVVAAGAFAGPALAVSVTTLLTTEPAADDHVRYARSQAVEFNDYVPGAERWLARGPALLAVLFFAVWAVGIWAGPLPQDDLPVLLNGVILVLVSVASLGIFEIAGRRIVATANTAGSPEELVWEDAMRSHTVRNMFSAPALVGLYAILYSLPTHFGGGIPSELMAWSGVVFTAGLLLLLLLTTTLRPERHFLRRLWPELAATTGKPYGADATSSPSGTED